jgi:hypothetical protein
MMTTTTKAIEQQSLSLDSISHLIEFELEGMLIEEFEQGLPTDLILGV